MPDRHAVVRLDAIARSSAPRFPSSPIHRPIQVPVFETASIGAPAREPVGSRTGGAAVSIGFSALFDEYTATPPDTQGAVGRNDVVSMVNSQVLVQSRSGAVRAGYPLSLDQFWGPLGNFSKLFDPRLLYDAAGDRWIASSGANPWAADAALLLAVSRSGDAGGAWDLFQIQVGPSGVWADYPVLGFNARWIVLSANLLTLPPDGEYARTAIYAFDKAAIYQGRGAAYATFNDTEGAFAPVVDREGTGDKLWLARVFAGASHARIRLSTIGGTVGSESFAAGAAEIALPGNWADGPPQDPDFAPQSGSWLKVDAGDSRLQNCLLRAGTIWCVHTVFLPAEAPVRSALEWFAVDPEAGALREHGLIDDPAGERFYAFPSIAVNQRGDALIGYTRFTAGDYPSAGFAFRAGGAPGRFQNGSIVKPGEAAYVGRDADESANRWGDFSATVVDPADGLTFWTIQEYAAIPTNHYLGRWATWWASVVVVR